MRKRKEKLKRDQQLTWGFLGLLKLALVALYITFVGRVDENKLPHKKHDEQAGEIN